MTQEDERVERAVAGSSDELEGLLQECLPRLRTNLRIQPIWSRSFEVDDVVQVTLLEAFLRIGTLKVQTFAGFWKWLDRMAQNNLKDAVRALERDKRPDAHRRQTKGPSGESARTLLSLVAEETVTSGGRAAVNEELKRMQAAIDGLPPSYREVVRLVDLEECSVPEVAEKLKKSAGAVHMLRARAHARLAELLRR